MILVEGNAAAALGLHDGRRHRRRVVSDHAVVFAARNADRLSKKYRKDPETGKATYAVVQAEDEIASIGMVVGAGWAGARAMTSTSGPGISLMGEFAGPGVLRRSSRRGVRHPARRAVDRAADAHGAGGPALDRGAVARRHQADHAASRRRPRSATRWRWRRSISRSASR